MRGCAAKQRQELEEGVRTDQSSVRVRRFLISGLSTPHTEGTSGSDVHELGQRQQLIGLCCVLPSLVAAHPQREVGFSLLGQGWPWGWFLHPLGRNPSWHAGGGSG